LKSQIDTIARTEPFLGYDAAVTAAGKVAVRRSGSVRDRITLPNPAKSSD